jgi:hypothetical protein
MCEDRSNPRIVQSGRDVKSWLRHLPSSDEERPRRCPVCGAASRPHGGRLQVHGHGLRDRQQRGPLAPDGSPVVIGILARRYLCLACGAVILVVPCGVLPGRQFSAGAIAWALALFGVAGLPARTVRARASPWRVVGATAATGWVSLRRWLRAVRQGRLFACVRAAPVTWTWRQLAARIATTLAARAPPGLRHLSLVDQAFHGAMQDG